MRPGQQGLDNGNGSPYRGTLLILTVLVLPSVLLTWMLYGMLTEYQPQYSDRINFVSAKFFGCGIGGLLHIAYWISGVFHKSFQVVKNRLREFFSFLRLSPALAFKVYFGDIAENGIAFWLYFAIVALNAWVAVDAFFEFSELWGWL